MRPRFALAAAAVLALACGGGTTDPSDAPPLGWYDYAYAYDKGAIGFAAGTQKVTGTFRLDAVGDVVTGVVGGTRSFAAASGQVATSTDPQVAFSGFRDAAGYKIVVGSNPREMMALRMASGRVACAFTAIYVGVVDGVAHRVDASCTVTPRSGP